MGMTDVIDAPRSVSTTARDTLVPIKKIKNLEQLKELFRTLEASFRDIDVLQVERKKMKRQLRSWNASFEQKYGREVYS